MSEDRYRNVRAGLEFRVLRGIGAWFSAALWLVGISPRTVSMPIRVTDQIVAVGIQACKEQGGETG